MALMTKIQTLDADGQRQILSLYTDEHPEYKFPIELRNIFAETIESAVCGGNINSVDGGLDPSNPLHRENIVSFLESLISLLNERLGNNQSGDQFFVRHKLLEALSNIQAKKQSDPLGLFDYIRNKIKAEISLVAQQEADRNTMGLHEKDVIMENITYMKNQINITSSTLQDIRANDEKFALNCNEKQRLEGILTNPDQLQVVLQQNPNDGESRVRQSLAAVERDMEQNIRNLQILIHRFEQMMQTNLQNIVILEGQIIHEKLAIWKHEQQKMANNIVDRNGNPNIRGHSISLDKLQVWCEALAELIKKSYDQLKEAEKILQEGLIQTGDPSHLKFVQGRADDVCLLLQRLLNHSFVVSEQPPQIIKMKTKFPKIVVVRLLVGRNFKLHINKDVKTEIISEEQVQTLHVADKIENVGELTNGSQSLNETDNGRTLTATFKNLQLKSVKRTDRRGSGSQGTERVMEEKACLYFQCEVMLGNLLFKLTTISLPVVVISHGSQEALAVATISWDNAFGEIGRQSFKVPQTAPWAEVAQILNAKFHEVAGRGLTDENLACLAQKAFRNKKPLPETITWSELCKENLPNRNFTFWTWFHAALKLVEKKETHLKDLWKEGLICGFIERETAENLISHREPGTFLLRFADSIPGAITIALLVKPDTVVSLSPYQMLDLQTKSLAKSIKEIEEVRYLYRPTGLIFKDDAFGKFYEKETPQTPTGPNTKPYVPLIPSVPDGERNGSATPAPSYEAGRRHSGNLVAHSPISLEPSHSPSPFIPQSPPSTLHELQPIPSSIMHSTPDMFDASRNTHTPVRYLSGENSSSSSDFSNQALETPTAVSNSNQIFQYPTDSEMFDDLIRVITTDTSDQMEIQL